MRNGEQQLEGDNNNSIYNETDGVCLAHQYVDGLSGIVIISIFLVSENQMYVIGCGIIYWVRCLISKLGCSNSSTPHSFKLIPTTHFSFLKF